MFEHGPAAVTPESEFELKGDVDVHLIRPGGAEFAPDQACITGTATDPLCIIWNGVFDLCGLLGPSDMVDVPEFFAPAGRKGWTVAKAGAEVWVSFGFPLDSPLSSEPLSVALQLKGPCPDTECGLIPGSDLVIPLDRYSIHLRGKGGVTHNAACHAAFNQLLGGDTDLVITAPTP